MRLTAKAGDEAAAHELLAAEEAEVRAILGPIVFGVDDDTMEIGGRRRPATRRGLTLGLAESVTGGLLGVAPHRRRRACRTCSAARSCPTPAR